ncbi:MAG: hypothetical protein WD716_13775 [Fimbriimonadaceae bacterium]
MKGWQLALIIVGVLAAFVVGAFVIYGRKQDLTAQRLEQARDAARKEGLPTNANEFRNILGEPKGTNAFDVIKEIEALSKSRKELRKKGPMDFERHEYSSPQVQRELADYLALFDKAATADCYVATRVWEDGLIVSFSDFAEVKYLARLAIGRADLHVRMGRIAAAIDDAERVSRIAGFLRSERHQIAALVACAIESEVASFILEHARDIRVAQDVERAQALLDTLLAPSGVREWLIGDMVMLLETIRFICEGGEQAADFYTAAQTVDGVREAKPFSKSQSYKFQAEAIMAYTTFFKKASDDVTDVDDNALARMEIAKLLVEWTLVHGFPREVVLIIEALGGFEDVFEARFALALKGDMYRKAFGIARGVPKAWPQDKSYVAGSYGAKASYRFNRTPLGFSLTCTGISEGPIEVHYPRKP